MTFWMGQGATSQTAPNSSLGCRGPQSIGGQAQTALGGGRVPQLSILAAPTAREGEVERAYEHDHRA
jgi:hypothetical protein